MQINTEYKDKALSYLQRLDDVRFVGQVLFVVIVLLVSWSGIKSIQTNYTLQKKITSINHQNSLQQLRNDNLRLQNEYYKSNQYLDIAARQNFGLAAPGEKEVVVSPEVALAHTVDRPVTEKVDAAKAKQPAYQRNIQSWIDFFLHRQPSAD